MRDPNRLDDFYDRLKKVHKERFCDLRFCQLLICIFDSDDRDHFYMEDDEMIKLIEEWRK